jgi:hypothetical protein
MHTSRLTPESEKLPHARGDSRKSVSEDLVLNALPYTVDTKDCILGVKAAEV